MELQDDWEERSKVEQILEEIGGALLLMLFGSGLLAAGIQVLNFFTGI